MTHAYKSADCMLFTKPSGALSKDENVNKTKFRYKAPPVDQFTY